MLPLGVNSLGPARPIYQGLQPPDLLGQVHRKRGLGSSASGPVKRERTFAGGEHVVGIIGKIRAGSEEVGQQAGVLGRKGTVMGTRGEQVFHGEMEGLFRGHIQQFAQGDIRFGPGLDRLRLFFEQHRGQRLREPVDLTEEIIAANQWRVAVTGKVPIPLTSAVPVNRLASTVPER